jgi:predicted ATPase
VLVSEVTRALLRDASIALRDLGVHHLKGLDRPERITQVDVPGLPVAFPPLRTAAPKNNLPASTTALVGRDAEVTALGDLLERSRVVTLLGPGGMGKTRLAVAAAARRVASYDDGVVFVDLSAVRDPELVAGAIAGALDLEASSFDAAMAHLATREVLLVLDNFEQVLAAAPTVAALLAGGPRLRALITSQAPLGIAGEQRFPLAPLAQGGAGTELFVARACEVDPAFDGDRTLVGRIVEALDGLPLAIELAASRAHVIPLEAMLARVENPAFLATRSAAAPERHRSLTATLWWSHDLLVEADRIALRRLGVFLGGTTVEAAEAVISGRGIDDPLTAITELLDRSLIVRAADGSGRLTLLDGVRRFALERLEEAGDDDAAERHTAWFLTLAAGAERGVLSDRAAWWGARLSAEHGNLRAALDRLLAAGDAERGLTMLGDLWRFLQSSGHHLELDRWLAHFFALPSAATEGVGRIKGLLARGASHYWHSEADAAMRHYREAVAIASTLGDDTLLAEAYYGLGTSAVVARLDDEAEAALDAAMRHYQALGDLGAHANILAGQLYVRIQREGPLGLDDDWGEIERLEREAGRVVQVVHAKYARAGLAVAEGRHHDARTTALEGLALAEELSDHHLIAWGLEWMAMAEVELGETERAGLLIGAGERARKTHGGSWSPEVLGIDDAPTRLRTALGDRGAEEAIAAGRELSLDEGLEVARRTATP